MGRFPTRRRVIVAALLLIAGFPAPSRANRASEILRARAAAEFYSLDDQRAIPTYREAIAADPQDAGAYRGLAGVLWMKITFSRGMLTVDSYLGRVSRENIGLPPAPPAIVAEFNNAIERAITLSRARVTANPKDA